MRVPDTTSYDRSLGACCIAHSSRASIGCVSTPSWDGGDVVDVGSGDGYHLPRVAFSPARRSGTCTEVHERENAAEDVTTTPGADPARVGDALRRTLAGAPQIHVLDGAARASITAGDGSRGHRQSRGR